jgi:NAD(P)-dependent dehydrogenase (short-subunit alcohol dehydrogenase family)
VKWRKWGKAIAIPTDVADYAQVEAAAEIIEAKLGPIDIWVNDARAALFAPTQDIAPEDFRRITSVTYPIGAVRTSRRQKLYLNILLN